MEWHGGTLGALDIATARSFVAYLQDAPKWQSHPGIPTSTETLSAQTVAGHVRVLKGFATWLAEEGYLATNPLARPTKPKVPTLLTEVLRPEEVKRLLNSCNPSSATGGRDLAIVTLFLDTGLRLSELVGLTDEDVHLEEGWLKVFGKGGKERVVPFGSRTSKVLGRYAIFYRPEDCDAESFFVNADGSELTANTIKMLFVRLRTKANLPRLHPHLLRHTFATSYLIAGGDVFSLQAILGHTTLEMTRRYVSLASSQVAIQHKRFSPMDRLGTRDLRTVSRGRTRQFRADRVSKPDRPTIGSKGRALETAR